MTPRYIVDTGPLVALLSKRDSHHRWALETFASVNPPALTCEAVLADFNAGVRAYDIKDPHAPREVAWFVPPKPDSSPVPTAQINDVFVDNRGIVFAVDRHAGGLYALEMTL